MATATILYGTDAAFTVTNLHSIATSATLLAGWTSGSVNNTSTLAMDYMISGRFEVNTGAAPTADTQIQLWAYSCENDTPTWPDLFSAGTEGTEGTATVHDAEMMSGMRLLWSTVVDANTSDVYTVPYTSIAQAFGHVPPYFALFVTHNTGQNLHSAVNALYYMPIKYSVA